MPIKQRTKPKAAASKPKKRGTKAATKAKPKARRATKATLKRKAAATKKVAPKGTIPLKLKLGTATFNGFLKPLPPLGAWGGAEAFDIIVVGQQGKASISRATGRWVITSPVLLPQQMQADIVNTIMSYYNSRGFNTPL